MRTLSFHESKIGLALARAALPAGTFLEGGGEATLDRLAVWLKQTSETGARGTKALLWAAEAAAVPIAGRPMSMLDPARAAQVLESWQASPSHAQRAFVRLLLTPIKAAHFDDPKMFEHVGCRHGSTLAPVRDEPAKWMRQVTNGSEVDDDLALECEVVVVGTGAGGAACAHELATRGHAVLLLEEGDYHRRSSFTTRASEMTNRLYRDAGLTVAFGNVGIPIFAGRAVGGTTLINSGTCYRAPERTFAKWRADLGLGWFSSAAMAPYYDKVEQMLQVQSAPIEHIGGIGHVIARGAGKLGLVHGPISRNAPACDGQGVCCFGCPTGAKRSTDVSYVPAALERGAQLVTAARVTGIDVVSGRARGVSGILGSGRKFTVKAEAVVLAGGALMTPVLAARSGALKSPDVGRHLSLHPATKVMAVFDETIDMSRGIPQGYAVKHPTDDTIVFEGASTPLDVTALAVPWVGARFMQLMEAYPHVATFGMMIQDTSRGRVRPGQSGSPIVTYDMNAYDTAKMQEGMATLCDMFLAAGARRVLPMIPGFDEIAGPADVARFRAARLAPSDIEVSAYHLLGTCRMGMNPYRSVVGPDHETHEVRALYIADGSVVSSSLGVNPQMTIMAMALRAGELISSRLS
ncbi:GMC family oxidoreductase [soil metagenome]